MDETKVRPGFPGDRSQAAAEKLRALRERANQALDDHRRRLGEIESQLSDRVRHLAEEYGATLGNGGPTTPAQAEELAALRHQLEEGRAKHEKFVEQLTAARKQLDAIQSQPCTTCQHAAEQLATAEEEARRLRDQIEVASRRHEEDRQRHENFVEQLQAARQAITVLQHSAGESSAELRGELEAARAARVAIEEQFAAATRDMEALHAECDATRARAEELEQELATACAESESLREQAAAVGEQHGVAATEAGELQARTSELDAQLQQARLTEVALKHEVESLGEQLVELQTEMAADAQRVAEQGAAAEAEGAHLRHQLQALESEKLVLALSAEQSASAVHDLQIGLAAAEDRCTAAEQRLAAAVEQCTAAEQRLAAIQEQTAAAADAPELRSQLEQAQAAADERVQLIGELKKTLDEARRELDDLRATMAPRAELEAVQRERQSEHNLVEELRQSVVALQAEVDAATRQASQAQSELVQAQADAEQALAEALQTQAAADEATAAAAAQGSSRPAAELAELQLKFDLALADVQKLKRENGNLREEVAARPEASDEESPELIATRSERDALELRVTELEQEAEATAATAVVGDGDQERADLQRRFELAVDDVRQLKQENAQLREKLTAGGAAGAAAPAESGGTDWAAQRARLMVMLEEEDGGGDVTAERTAERATVAKTIAATDRVVANKDEEIAELRAALENRGPIDGVDAAEADRREEILGADEIVAAERQRLAALTVEWEGKLRAAELEFSVERAKLAREQAAVREQMFDLKANAPEATVDNGDVSKPKRRWLSALGLHDDADEPKKKR